MYRHAADIENKETKDPRTHAHAQLSSLFNLGCLLADEGAHDDAAAVFKEAVERSTDDYPLHSLYNMLGKSLIGMDGRQCFAHKQRRSASIMRLGFI